MVATQKPAKTGEEYCKIILVLRKTFSVNARSAFEELLSTSY